MASLTYSTTNHKLKDFQEELEGQGESSNLLLKDIIRRITHLWGHLMIQTELGFAPRKAEETTGKSKHNHSNGVIEQLPQAVVYLRKTHAFGG